MALKGIVPTGRAGVPGRYPATTSRAGAVRPTGVLFPGAALIAEAIPPTVHLALTAGPPHSEVQLIRVRPHLTEVLQVTVVRARVIPLPAVPDTGVQEAARVAPVPSGVPRHRQGLPEHVLQEEGAGRNKFSPPTKQS